MNSYLLGVLHVIQIANLYRYHNFLASIRRVKEYCVSGVNFTIPSFSFFLLCARYVPRSFQYAI